MPLGIINTKFIIVMHTLRQVSLSKTCTTSSWTSVYRQTATIWTQTQYAIEMPVAAIMHGYSQNDY